MYADIIISISHEQLDRPFEYRIPEALQPDISVGCMVLVPFGRGNRQITGYVVGLHQKPVCEPSRIKELLGVPEQSIGITDPMLQLAAWMRKRYGCTMITALKTVTPVKAKVHQREKQILHRGEPEVFETYRRKAKKKNWKARLRLLEALEQQETISMELAAAQLGTTKAVLLPLLEAGAVRMESGVHYRNPIDRDYGRAKSLSLKKEQQEAVCGILQEWKKEQPRPCLLYGVTGSGKTEVYMEVLTHVLQEGKQAIVLIPEISLTYQMVMRFYKRFGDRISIVNSRLSAGERYDQFERAKNGEIDIMIGPRSALFTPFAHLGAIILDEEQESAYKSETAPRYHAREVAAFRAAQTHALLVLGSATPSMESFYRAQTGTYRLFELRERAVSGSALAEVEVVDLKKEMEEGNRSVFSRALRREMEQCLEQKHQMMLFLNRRGYSRVVSCRSCGKPIGCPHCDVSLTLHNNGRLTCHYCGYSIPMPKQCPACGSPYLAGFGLGTQKVEQLTAAMFPNARILRMDYDTTSTKGSMEALLEQFSTHQADILIGTQMIVKGHDFPDVTLVGILAADMSLHVEDFRSGERTFQLLTQAAGRAGRGILAGRVIIQAYDTENYCIEAAAAQDYRRFYEREISYRRLLHYPPAGEFCQILVSADGMELARQCADQITALLKSRFHDTIQIVGPSDAGIVKLQDHYRRQLFLKADGENGLSPAMLLVEEYASGLEKKRVTVTIDLL